MAGVDIVVDFLAEVSFMYIGDGSAVAAACPQCY